MGHRRFDELIHLVTRPRIGSTAMCKLPDLLLDNDNVSGTKNEDCSITQYGTVILRGKHQTQSTNYFVQCPCGL